MRMLFLAQKAAERLVGGAATVEMVFLDQRDAARLIGDIIWMLKSWDLDQKTRDRLAVIRIVCKSDGKATIIGSPT